MSIKHLLIIKRLFFMLGIVLLLFVNYIGVVDYRGDDENVYGRTNLFEMIVNNRCPELVDPHVFNYEAQQYESYANSIVICDEDKRWFSGWYIENILRKIMR